MTLCWSFKVTILESTFTIIFYEFTFNIMGEMARGRRRRERDDGSEEKETKGEVAGGK